MAPTAAERVRRRLLPDARRAPPLLAGPRSAPEEANPERGRACGHAGPEPTP